MGNALVLDGAGQIRMANPFAAQPTPFRVEAGGRSWFAEDSCAFLAASGPAQDPALSAARTDSGAG